MNVAWIAAWIVLPTLSIALLLGFIRLAMGPTLPDRVVAFEFVAILLVGIIVVYAIIYHQGSLLDVASVWAIISFLSVVAIAVYIDKARKR